MTLTAQNDFHNTLADIETVETYETKYGGMVAVVTEDDLDRAGRELCGMADCTCSGPHAAVDADGAVYSLTCCD